MSLRCPLCLSEKFTEKKERGEGGPYIICQCECGVSFPKSMAVNICSEVEAERYLEKIRSAKLIGCNDEI